MITFIAGFICGIIIATVVTSLGVYDMIIGDPIFKDMLQDYQGQYLELIHFAVSGRRDFS